MGMGSAYEVEYHALLARDLCLLEPNVYLELQTSIVEVKRMLAALLLKVRSER